MNKLKAFLTVSAGFTLLSALGCASSAPFVEPPLPVTEKDTKVPGESLTEKLAWLESNADSRNIYILEVNANENIAPRTFEYTGATNINIVIRGVGENHPTIRLSEHGTMFTVKTNVMLVLDGNITLMGHSQNTGPMINVDGGLFWMRTGTNVSGNDRGSGNGGGVYVGSGAFKMTGGTVSGNTAENGGGVYVNSASKITLPGGIISGNTANTGGGVYLENGSSMYPTDNSIATITGNVARKNGGGMYVANGNANITTHGAGFYVVTDIGDIKKGSLVVTGYESDPNNGNVVKDEEGNILSQKGHSLFYARDSYKDNNGLTRYHEIYSDKTRGKRDNGNNEQSDAQAEE
jgi:hypothetical protein